MVKVGFRGIKHTEQGEHQIRQWKKPDILADGLGGSHLFCQFLFGCVCVYEGDVENVAEVTTDIWMCQGLVESQG